MKLFFLKEIEWNEIRFGIGDKWGVVSFEDLLFRLVFFIEKF